jgi:lipooligosaccharide transport system ATP-binding protein
MEEAEQICDRLLIMNQGQIIAEGSPSELIQKHVGGEVLEIVPEDGAETAILVEVEGCYPYQRLGDKLEIFTPDGSAMLKRLKSRGPLSSYGIRRPNLEDVFLRLTGRDLRE